MIVCALTKKDKAGGDVCSEKHRSKCNGLVVGCAEYKPKEEKKDTKK